MSNHFKPVWIRWLGALAILAIGVTGVQPVLAQSTIDLVLHYIEGAPSETEISYDVTAFVSVVDSAGSPINDLGLQDFSLTEDSQKVEITAVGLAEDPVNLVLLIDTSGSMGGQGITAAKAAASSFVTSLMPEDRVSVISFNETSTIVTDFTADHTVARDRIALIESTRNAGTCLYDAMYSAVQSTATVPSGRRAVILFTDGVDESAGGGPCSIHTGEDVIELAKDGGTRSPLYTLGMGTKVDQNGMKRLAETTGGRFFYSPDSGKVDAIFRDLSNALRSQYAITYSSKAGPGAHTLAVVARYLGSQDTDTRGYLLPNFPFRLIFVQPLADSQVGDSVSVVLETFGQAETVEAVTVEVDGTTLLRIETAPYQADLSLEGLSSGSITLEAVALGADGIELDRVAQTVQYDSGTPPIVEKDDPQNITWWQNPMILAGGGVLLGAVVLGGGAVYYLKRRKKEQDRDAEWDRQVGGVSTPENPSPLNESTLDSWEIPSDALARLRVMSSDDSNMVNAQFDIINRVTRLGRKADNDITFPKDSPVSRHHAQIEERNGGLFISEVVDPETSKRPSYGTFVNDREVGDQTVLLQQGDEIRLGKRVILKFEAGRSSAGDEGTMDGLSEDTMDTRTM